MTLSDLLQQASEKHPQKTALVFFEQSWTYSQIYQSTLSCAAGLSQNGIKAGDRVAIFSKNCPEFIISVFALSHLGAVAVPINYMVKPEEIKFILSDISATVLITQNALLGTVPEVQKIYTALKQIWVVGLEKEEGVFKYFSSLYLEFPSIAFDCREENTMLILYTSGTTGTPKGAMLSHGNLCSNAKSSSEALGIKASDTFLLILPLFHVFAWTTNVLVPLHAGAGIILTDAIRPPKPWLRLMAKHKVTCFTAVPQIYAVLADQAKGFKKWVLRMYFFRSVRLCISGAAPLMKETSEKFEQNFGRPIMEGYGLTETSPVTNCNTLKARKPGSVGKALPQVKIKIIDTEEKELPLGQEGEICVSGPNVMLGYFNLPEATKAAFTKDGWFKTGDVGEIDSEGFLYIRDRIKDMIIVKGLKVFSAQVEDILLAHPAILEAAVVGIPDSTGDEYVKAFVVLKEGVTQQKQDLLNFCKEKLPPYKRPRDIEIRNELPKNALQKVLKRQLRAESARSQPNEKI